MYGRSALSSSTLHLPSSPPSQRASPSPTTTTPAPLPLSSSMPMSEHLSPTPPSHQPPSSTQPPLGPQLSSTSASQVSPGPSAAKRKRVTKACLVCAKSRRKCDGIQPFCGTCRTQGTQCAWSDIPTRRGPPKGYRRGTADPSSLIPKIGKIREHVQALQLAYGDRLVLDELHRTIFGSQCICPNYGSAGASGSRASSGLTEHGHGRGHSHGHSSSSVGAGPSTPSTITEARHDPGGSDRIKAKSEWSQDEHEEDRTNSDLDEGSSSGLAFLATSIRYMHTDARGGSGPLTPVSDGERLPLEKYSPWAMNNDRLEQHPLQRRRSSATGTHAHLHPSPAEVEILLKTYWTSIHPHWPILYKPFFDAISIFHIYDQVPLALLYAIYCLSSRLTPTPELNAQVAETYRRQAEEELTAEGAFRSDINSCTALFLLSLYYQGEGNQRQAWVTCGFAAMMALDLGLHKSTGHYSLVDHERRLRVFWNIFVYEKVLAAEMGRPVMIRMEHCDPVRLSEEQSDEYETVVHPATGTAVRPYTISIFNAAVDLFNIFERILSSVHTVPSLMTMTRAQRERLVADLDSELEEWQQSLGQRSRYPKSDDRQPTRSLYLMHAWYHNAMILLHRPLIPRFRAGQPFASNIHHRKATEHANRLVDLLAQFAAGQNIETLPPNDAYLIFSAAILHVFNLTLSDKSFRDHARPRLERCIEWLRALAGTWSAASQHKSLLDAFSQVAANTISHTLSPTSSNSMSASPPQHAQSQPIPHNAPYPTAPIAGPGVSGVHYVSHGTPEYGPEQQLPAGPPTADMASGHVHHHQSQQQQQQQYAPELEQNATAPQLFSLETYYWNDFQAAATYGQHVGGYYQHPQQDHNVYTHEGAGGVYNSIVQHLQQEDPSRIQ